MDPKKPRTIVKTNSENNPVADRPRHLFRLFLGPATPVDEMAALRNVVVDDCGSMVGLAHGGLGAECQWPKDIRVGLRHGNLTMVKCCRLWARAERHEKRVSDRSDWLSVYPKP